MGQNPFVLAAKAAHAELSSEAAKQFFKDTALQHIGLTVFYLTQAVFYTVEAGKMTRALVNGWRTLETVSTEPQAIAGLLPLAKEKPPLTTEMAVITNEQKFEQHITTAIKGIYDVPFIQDNQDGFSGDRQDSSPNDSQCLELVHQPVSSQVENRHQEKDPATPTRKRKPLASSGDPGQANDPKTKGRVPRSRRKVPAQ